MHRKMLTGTLSRNTSKLFGVSEMESFLFPHPPAEWWSIVWDASVNGTLRSIPPIRERVDLPTLGSGIFKVYTFFSNIRTIL